MIGLINQFYIKLLSDVSIKISQLICHFWEKKIDHIFFLNDRIWYILNQY